MLLPIGGSMLQKLLKGAVAGTTGAFAMSVALRDAFPMLLPTDLKTEFLPKKVIEGLEARTFGRGSFSGEQKMYIAEAAHYIYGASVGVLYSIVRARLDRCPPVALGTVYGVGIWAISYEGWLPAAGILEATTEQPRRQWVVPIVAHVVYGITTALTYQLVSRSLRNPSTPARRVPRSF